MVAGNHLKNEDGSWKYTNKLHHEVSIYLQSHAHDPIDWYPWGEEALEKSKHENKPIFLSIGYSTCYWCHVMQREVFHNEIIADYFNQHFINIKIDREERPDLDDIYMVARQLLTHEGGWPNNAFLTQDLQPFYVGGVFLGGSDASPPQILRVLENITQLWHHKKDELLKNAKYITAGIEYNFTTKLQANDSAADLLPVHLFNALWLQVKHIFDHTNGGFFQAPKFPHENYLLFLLSYFKESGASDILPIVRKSLDHMAAGGIYDHVGGGFHRYATDAEWFIPHFEKMLYTQALVTRCYTEAYHIFEFPYYRDIICHTLDFVSEQLMRQDGLFYSGIDAETDSVEGAYYVWTETEIETLLGKKLTDRFFEHYALVPLPKIPGHAHAKGGALVVKQNTGFANGVPKEIQEALSILNKSRTKRPMPLRDDKIILAWNGMMIATFVYAGNILHRQDYINIALQAAEKIEEVLINKKGEVIRLIRGVGHSKQKAFLEDYAWFIYALLEIYTVTKKKEWLEKAIYYTQEVNKLFWDNENKGYFFTRGEEHVLVRMKIGRDASIPADNAIMLHNLITLHLVTKDVTWSKQALELIELFYSEMASAPLNYPSIFDAMLLLPKELLDKMAMSMAKSQIGIANDNLTVSSEHVKVTIKGLDKTIPLNKKISVSIELAIDEGWYINAHEAITQHFIPTQVDIRGIEGLHIEAIHYPQATSSLVNKGIITPLYTGVITIEVDMILQEKPENKEPIAKILITVQACKEEVCLLPSDIIISQLLSF